MQLALACERFGEGLLGQPANAATSLAFVVAAGAVLATGRAAAAIPAAGPVPPGVSRPAGSRWVGGGAPGVRWTYPLLVAAVGVGSLVQHGPHPSWQAYAHDLPLAALLGFVAADAAADLAGGAGPGGRRHRLLVRWSWPAVAVGMLPVVALGPLASTLVQGALAAAAIGLNLARARRRPRLRRTLLPALAILAAGAIAGSATDRTPLCQPDSLLQGHAAWHLLAAAALWWLAPAIESRGNGPVPAASGPGSRPGDAATCASAC